MTADYDPFTGARITDAAPKVGDPRLGVPSEKFGTFSIPLLTADRRQAVMCMIFPPEELRDASLEEIEGRGAGGRSRNAQNDRGGDSSIVHIGSADGRRRQECHRGAADTRERALARRIGNMGNSVLVLAMWQPWATLSVAPDPEHGGVPAKVHETRHWAPRVRLPIRLAIHATKTFNDECRAAFDDPQFKRALVRCGFYPGDPRPILNGRVRSSLRPVPLGGIVGLATLVSVVPTIDREAVFQAVHSLDGHVAHHADDLKFGNFLFGRFAWRFADTLMLPVRVPHRGRQDVLYALPETEEAGLRAQLGDQEWARLRQVSPQ